MTRSAKAPVAVGVTLPTDDKEGARLNVQVRPQGGASYALVDPGIGLITTSRDLHHVLLPPGVHVRVFATAGGRGGFAELSGEPDTITIVKYEDLCTLRAKIPQSRGERHPVRVLCRRKEGEEEVLAQGWSVVAQTPGLADVSLPVGTYRVCILEGTREGPSVTWTFDKPGSQAQIDLTLP